MWKTPFGVVHGWAVNPVVNWQLTRIEGHLMYSMEGLSGGGAWLESMGAWASAGAIANTKANTILSERLRIGLYLNFMTVTLFGVNTQHFSSSC